MADLSDKELLDELGVEVEEKKLAKLTPVQERVIAGFEDIQRFVEEHDRPPTHGEDKDIFERLYAVRLDKIQSSSEYLELLQEIDHQGLLDHAGAEGVEEEQADLTDEELLSELGIDEEKTWLTDRS